MHGFSKGWICGSKNLKIEWIFEPRIRLYTKVIEVQKVCDVFRKRFFESTRTSYYTTRMIISSTYTTNFVMLLEYNNYKSEFPDQIWGSGALNTLYLLALQQAQPSMMRFMRNYLGSKIRSIFKFLLPPIQPLLNPPILFKQPFLSLVFLHNEEIEVILGINSLKLPGWGNEQRVEFKELQIKFDIWYYYVDISEGKFNFPSEMST